MPNPKRRHSHARTHRRRAHDHLKTKDLGLCPNCQQPKMAHHVCPNCGQYKDRQIFKPET